MKKLVLLAALWIPSAGVYGCSAQLSESKTNSLNVVMPTGTVLKVELIDAVGTDKSTPGDHFSASLAEAVVIDGKTIFEEGTQVRGRVFYLRQPRRLNNGAALHLILTEIMHKGKVITITTLQYEATSDTSGIARDSDIRFAVRHRLDFILATPVEI